MIKTFIRGFLIGSAKIIPGFSGSLLAMFLGVYEPTLDIIVNLKKINIKKILFLLCLGLGIIIGIIFFSVIVKFLLNRLYFPTMLFFIGMIVASVRDLFKEVKNYLLTIKGTFFCLFSVILVFSLDYFRFSSFQIINNYTYFPLGVIEALTTLIPGISGTSVYMILGVYDIILDFYANLFNPDNLISFFYFFLGLLIGGYLVAKIILLLLNKYRNIIMTIIFGFMVSAIIVLFKDALINSFNIINFILGAFLLILGFGLVNIVNHIFKRKA